jgi:hypothetical protein
MPIFTTGMASNPHATNPGCTPTESTNAADNRHESSPAIFDAAVRRGIGNGVARRRRAPR